MKLLLVQELRTASKTLPVSLGKLGYRVATSVPRECIEVIKQGGLDLILLDVNPSISLELLRSIKSSIKTFSVPVIVMSARPTREQVLNSVQAGAANFIDKGSMSLDVVQEKIQKVMGGGAKSVPEKGPVVQARRLSSPAQLSPPPAGLSVVVISPKKHLGQMMKREMKGIELIASTYGEQLMKDILGTPPHVVLIDDQLSNSLQVALMIRSKLKQVGVVLISRAVTRDKVVGAARSGIAGIVVYPFSPALLLDTIRRAFEKTGNTAQSLVPSTSAAAHVGAAPPGEEVMDRLLQIDSVRSLPHIIERVLFITEDESTGATELEEVILTDANAASVLLKRVNSSFYSPEQEITRVRDAIARIGFEEVRSLMMTLSVIHNFGVEQKQMAFDRLRVWRASLATAIISRELAKHLGATAVEEAFLGGLLADLGKMILDEHLREKFEQAICLGHEQVFSLAAAERRVIGVDHTEVAARVLAKWEFPERIIDLVGRHEDMAWDPEASVDANIPAVIGLAKWIVLGLGIGDNAEILFDWVPAELLKSTNLAGFLNQDLIAQVVDELTGMLSYFKVSLGWPPESTGTSVVHYHDVADLPLSPLELIIRRLGGEPSKLASLNALNQLPPEAVALVHFPSVSDLKEKSSGKGWGDRPWLFVLPRGQFPISDELKERVGLPVGLCRYTERPFSLRRIEQDLAELGT